MLAYYRKQNNASYFLNCNKSSLKKKGVGEEKKEKRKIQQLVDIYSLLVLFLLLEEAIFKKK